MLAMFPFIGGRLLFLVELLFSLQWSCATQINQAVANDGIPPSQCFKRNFFMLGKEASLQEDVAFDTAERTGSVLPFS